jgi:hypothetical protein
MGSSGPVTPGVWHTVTVDIGTNLATLKIDGVTIYSGNLGGTVPPMGSFIGMQSETGGCYFDNIWIGYAGPAGKPGVQWYNVVTQYGADPTNTVDSTAAINAAIVAANATGYGGIVYLPPGWYTISAPINLNGVAFVEIRGDGTSSRLRPTAAFAGAAAIVVTAGGRNAVNNLLIQFAGAWNTNPVADGIQVVHSTYFHSSNVEVLSANGYAINVLTDTTGASSICFIDKLDTTNCKGGVNFQGVASSAQLSASITESYFNGTESNPCINIQDAQYVMVDKCESWANQGVGISISGVCTQVTIDNCNMGPYSAKTQPCLLIQASGGNSPTDIYISNSVFQGGSYPGQVTAGGRIFITNCEFIWGQFHGLSFNGSFGQVSVAYCAFYNNAGTAGTYFDLYCNITGYITVSGCMFLTGVNAGVAGAVTASCNFAGGNSIVTGCVVSVNAPFATRPTYAVNNNNDDTSNFRAVRAGGLAGTTSATRYVGASGGGSAPGAGTFAVGDFIVDPQGQIWICTVAGSPGTWTGIGSYSAFANANPNYTVPNDNLPHNVVGAVVTVNVLSGWEVLVNYSAYGLIMEGNAAAHAILSCNLFLDGAAVSGPTGGFLCGRNASTGYGAMISNIWKFTGLSGSHTIQLVCQWNGTASQALIQQSSISAVVSRPTM